MTSSALRRLAVLALALATPLAGAPPAHAAGAININSCQTLGIPNTTYKLTADLTSCSDCLIVAADKVTIDMQNHSITGSCNSGSAITDQQIGHDVVTVKNGTITGYVYGVLLDSARTTIIGVNSNNNVENGFFIRGNGSVVKSCVANNNGSFGVVVVADRAQVQQCDASSNGLTGITFAGNHCLVTMNSANNNAFDGIKTGADCTTSYNTTTGNGRWGIWSPFGFGPNGLITQNTAMGNLDKDFRIQCPEDVTFNTSSAGFPASYDLLGGSPGCRTANNE